MASDRAPAGDVADLLRGNGRSSGRARRPVLRFGHQTWTHEQLLAEAERFAALYGARLDRGRPPHVGVLLDNTPDYVFALCGAALVGAAVVGLNHTRRGEHLARDIAHTDVQFVITEPRHQLLVQSSGVVPELPGGVLISTRFVDADDPPIADGELLEDALAAAGAAEETDGLSKSAPGMGPKTAPATGEETPAPTGLAVLLFTSGTADAPKAVCCSQRRLRATGEYMATLLDIGPDDVGFAAMPLFHANSLMAGLMPALVSGASLSLARRFSASNFLSEVRQYGATWFNYTGKVLAHLLATPERSDDADNPLRIAFGNEGSAHIVEASAQRFAIEIIDVFGSTEGAIALDRAGARPRGSVGRLRPGIAVVDARGDSVPRARFDGHGRLVNAHECVGEIVNTTGVGPFEGYYRNPDAMRRATRHGWYWSGDLAYVDTDGWVYFAGRTSDWLRVDGENFPAAPIEAIVARHPDVVVAAAYGVPDAESGDQVMVAVVLQAQAAFDGRAFATWLDEQRDLSPRWRPRFVRQCQTMPTTSTNKVVTRTLAHQKFRGDRVGSDPVYVRERGDDSFRLFTPEDEESLRRAFEASGRVTVWDL